MAVAISIIGAVCAIVFWVVFVIVPAQTRAKQAERERLAREEIQKEAEADEDSGRVDAMFGKNDGTWATGQFEKACSLGRGSACDQLGKRYENGIGAPRDLARAVDSYRKACDLGNKDSCQKVELITESQKEEQRLAQSTAPKSEDQPPSDQAGSPPQTPVSAGTTQTQPPVDNPMAGDGGAIAPDAVAQPPADTNVNFCLPSFLVEKNSWDHPAPGSEMAAFRGYVSDYIWRHRGVNIQLRVRNEAFELFTERWHASGAYNLNPQYLFDTLPAGVQCPVHTLSYKVALRQP